SVAPAWRIWRRNCRASTACRWWMASLPRSSSPKGWSGWASRPRSAADTPPRWSSATKAFSPRPPLRAKPQGTGATAPSADGMVREALQRTHQAGVIEPAIAIGRTAVEQFLRARRVRQRYANGLRRLQSEVEVLLVQRHAEAGIEGALDHPLTMHVENAR